MKQELGWSAAIAVALAAAIGITSRNNPMASSDVNRPAQLPGRSSIQSAKSADMLAHGPCVDIEEDLQAFLVNGDRDSIAAPASCYGLSPPPAQDRALGAKIREKTGHLRFLIATLPDPVHTHFPLAFDRLMEAVQQGATDEQYIYDSSWLPWENEDDRFALIEDQDKEDERKKMREEQPGILLFRRNSCPKTANDSDPCKNEKKASRPYDKGLVIFIVGEEPTRGIHLAQFQNAAAWIAALKPEPGSNPAPYEFPDGILGPSFSGSLPSLANALLDLRIKSTMTTKPDIPIYSGSVTSKTLVEWFVQVTRESIDADLLSFQQSDDQAIKLYSLFLQHSGFHLNRLAIVSEDETAYGYDVPRGKQDKSSKTKEESPARLFYPRDLSALRTAYQKQSIFSQPSAQTAPDSARHTLTSDIADPEGRQHDTIRMYSGDQVALSQEAVLQQIVSQLRVHQSQYVLLRSSNPLDELFLSHYLRLAYPEGRIVVLGADLLLRRESGAARLSGIMTLSTYPLLPWQPDWTRTKDDASIHAHRVFPQDGAEGTYVAARYLLHLPPLLDPHSRPNELSHFLPASADSSLCIRDYSTPFWMGPHEGPVDQIAPPPTWLSVLGRNDFWPIAALTDDSVSKDLETMRLDERPRNFLGNLSGAAASLVRAWTPHRANLAYGDGKSENWSPEFLIPGSMKIALSILLAWTIFHLMCCILPSVMAKPSHRSYFVCYSASLHTHRTLLVIGSWVLSSVATVLECGLGAMSPVGLPVTHPALTLSYLPLIWAIAFSALVINIWRQPEAAPSFSGGKSKEPQSLTPELVSASLISQTIPEGNRLASDKRLAAETTAEKPVWFERLLLGIATFFITVARSLKLRWPSLWLPLLAFVAATILFYFGLYFCSEAVLNPANRIPTYWRSMNLTNGVSPIIPVLAPVIGIYLWFWYSLQGLAFFGPDHPKLPSEDSLKLEIDGKPRDWLRMFSHRDAAEPVEMQCEPFAGKTLGAGLFLVVILCLLGFFITGDTPIRSLGAKPYAILICVLVDICISMMLANAWRLLKVWIGLRSLLIFLYRLRLRRSMAAFPGVSWGSVWKVSSNVLDMRYKLLTRESECASHLQNSLDALETGRKCALDSPRSYPEVDDALKKLQEARMSFAEWYSKSWDKPDVRDQNSLAEFQECLAKCAGVLITKLLLPAWRNECAPECDFPAPQPGNSDCTKEGVGLTPVAKLDPHIRHAEQLVCYVYLGFIQNVLGRMRSVVMSILWLFIGVTISMASYPFDPRPVISGTMVLLFLTLGAFIVFVYAEMHRDPILSLVTNTKPGELGGEFWFKLVGFGAGPVLGLLATMFPELTDMLFSWVQPSISSVR
jgi:hypothetical protein